MGTFEKLGVLVIVVIIVMILAVAIYQWGGAATEPATAGMEQEPSTPGLSIRTIDEIAGERENESAPEPADREFWAGGIPKRYEIQPDDKIWIVVVKRWQLKPSFVSAITAANPRVNMKRLLPGTRLEIPNPASYFPTKKSERPPAAGLRRYEVKEGDTLESIALMHLGKRSRWPEILRLNKGLAPKSLVAGQSILIPAK